MKADLPWPWTNICARHSFTQAQLCLLLCPRQIFSLWNQEFTTESWIISGWGFSDLLFAVNNLIIVSTQNLFKEASSLISIHFQNSAVFHALHLVKYKLTEVCGFLSIAYVISLIKAHPKQMYQTWLQKWTLNSYGFYYPYRRQPSQLSLIFCFTLI